MIFACKVFLYKKIPIKFAIENTNQFSQTRRRFILQAVMLWCVYLARVFIVRSAKVSSPSQSHQSPAEMKWEKAKWANIHLYTRAAAKHEKQCGGGALVVHNYIYRVMCTV